MTDEAFEPFAPIRVSRVKERRDQIKRLFDSALLPADDITVSALVIVLHDASQLARVPVVDLVRALAALDGATVNVAVKLPVAESSTPPPGQPDDDDEDEQLIGGPVVN